jgi:mRNA-degrading endonuclease toxin of MazEF toxin-antitoxin module
MRRIIYVNFPFLDNRQKAKPRPALCLTNPIGRYKVMVVAFISTKCDEVLTTDITLDTMDSAFRNTGLKRLSFIRVHKLYSVVTDEVVGELGVLPVKWEKEVKAKLRQLFNL